MAVTILGKSCRIREYVVGVAYTDLAVAATTNNISGLVIPAKSYILDCWIKVNTNFLGGAISAYTLGLGVGSAELLAAASAFSGTPLIVAYGTAKDAEAYVKSTSATTDIRIYATSTTANLNAATQGQADIYLLVAESE